MKNNLVTGGLGLLGSYIARHLLEKGEVVTVFDPGNDTTLIQDLMERINVVRGDYSDWTAVAEVVKENEIESIFHVGALIPPEAEKSVHTTFNTNVQGTLNVLEAARLFDVSSVIYESSIGVYGADAPAVVGDDYIQMPSHLYGMSKVCGERLGEQYFRSYDVNFRGLRFPRILGPGRWVAGPGEYCDRAIGEPLCERGYTLDVEPATCLASAVFVKDAAEGMIALRDADKNDLFRRIYNIHGLSIMAEELMDEVKKHLPEAELEIEPDINISAAIRSWPRLDDTHARKDWLWNPRVTEVAAYVAECVAEGRARSFLYEKKPD